jgi:hypothetical protein
MRLWLVAVAVVLALVSSSSSQARRYAVVIGNNVGVAPEQELRFAEDDADRLARTLIDVGNFAAEDVVTLRGMSVAAVRRALIAMNARVRESADPSLLLVFYSGHADAQALHLGGEALPLDEIDGLTRASPASFRVLVLDACRSGALTQSKGSRAAPLFALPSVNGVAGYVVLTAAASGEDAAEANNLGASFFSHAFTSGLLGAADVNNDDLVSLAEAYDYAFDQTVKASSASFGGTQHPTFRYEVRGQGELILSTLHTSRSRGELRLPSGVSFLVLDERGRVVAEVDTNANRRLSLPAGRYALRGRAPRARYEGDVTVVAGAATTAELTAMARLDYARLVRKGTPDAALSMGAAVGPTVMSGAVVTPAPCLGVRAALPIDAPWLSFTPRLGVCQGRFENGPLLGIESQLEVGVDIHRYIDFNVLGVDASLGVGAVFLAAATRQDFVTAGEAPARQSIAPGGGLNVDLVVPFAQAGFVGVSVDARTLVLSVRDRSDAAAQLETPLSFGGALLVGWRLF